MTATTMVGAEAAGKPWLTSDQVMRIAVGVYLAVFFLYMFLPLVYMMLVTFNDSRIPTLTPWKGFTLRWFAEMWADERMWSSVVKSFIIGFWVIVLAIPLGLAGALFMTRMRMPGQSFVYAVLVSPVLMPGIIIGLSTLIFWDTQFRIGGRWQLSVLGQTSFIAAYCMLIFMARLTRFDRTLEEAALDLGATPFQVFRTIMVPYMRPAILSASVLAFLQSFENFNTTLFTIGNDITLTMYIAGKIRSGTTPALNALAFVMVAFTICAGVAYEILRRREAARAEARARAAREAELAAETGGAD
jgi:spermidine/putrescine transport system permease protein